MEQVTIVVDGTVDQRLAAEVQELRVRTELGARPSVVSRL